MSLAARQGIRVEVARVQAGPAGSRAAQVPLNLDVIQPTLAVRGMHVKLYGPSGQAWQRQTGFGSSYTSRSSLAQHRSDQMLDALSLPVEEPRHELVVHDREALDVVSNIWRHSLPLPKRNGNARHVGILAGKRDANLARP